DTKEILVKNSSIEVRRKAFTKATALAVGGLALATIVGANLNQDDQKAPITPKQTIEQSVAVIETEWAE
ncbi:hypothetical protein KC867_03640, partial [Candidatus Saccharibacteria bacterium]|nr:hypothetical protein [Candidatus Saccharibacteria bacterium]